MKDDGASTNILSKRFYERNSHLFTIKKSNLRISHSSSEKEEKRCAMTDHAKIKIGEHEYTSRLVLANIRYDIILGMPWRKDVKPGVQYAPRTIHISRQMIKAKEQRPENELVNQVSIRKFRRILKRKGTEIHAVRLNSVDIANEPFGKLPVSQEMKNIVNEYSDVFRSILPDGLPPARSIDHEIITDP